MLAIYGQDSGSENIILTFGLKYNFVSWFQERRKNNLQNLTVG